MSPTQRRYPFAKLTGSTMTHTFRAWRLLGLAGLGSLLAVAANAQDASYLYGGGSIGQSQARIDEDRINASLLAAGLTTTSMSKDQHDIGFKLFGGYQFNRYVALEGGYFNLGKFGFTSTTVPVGTLTGQIKLQGVNLDLVGSLPLGERWTVLGRVGAQYAQAKDSFSSTGAVSVGNPNPSKSAINYKYGAGLQYELNPSILVRAEAERYRVDDAVGNRGDVNFFAVSLVFPFGRTPAAAAPRPVALAPAYVEPPPPVPVPVPEVVAAVPVAPAVAPVAPLRVSFSADSLFAFDKSAIRPQGKADLDRFAKDLAGTRYEMIGVTGHTDRLGSDAYNLRLSTARANAVKAYLAQSGGIGAAKISAVGHGKTEPLTKTKECKGTKPTPKLIECLQADRRVDVEVSGTR